MAQVMHTADSTIYRNRWRIATVEKSNPGYLVTVRTRDWDRIREITCDTHEAATAAARKNAG